jgi:hypothetical protein
MEHVAHTGRMLVLADVGRRTHDPRATEPLAVRPTRNVDGASRCPTCGAELQDAAERFCGGDRCLRVFMPHSGPRAPGS